jgi:uncharacterized coiled-coil protein SlyX
MTPGELSRPAPGANGVRALTFWLLGGLGAALLAVLAALGAVARDAQQADRARLEAVEAQVRTQAVAIATLSADLRRALQWLEQIDAKLDALRTAPPPAAAGHR